MWQILCALICPTYHVYMSFLFLFTLSCINYIYILYMPVLFVVCVKDNRGVILLTFCHLVAHVKCSEVGHRWFRSWLVASSTAKNYQNQCKLIRNQSLSSNFPEIFNPNTNILIDKTGSVSIECGMVIIMYFIGVKNSGWYSIFSWKMPMYSLILVSAMRFH